MDDAFETILNSINNYLGKTRDAVDFSIIKDITDRNSDAVFNQVEAASPVPIYIGLCGTLIGIVAGVAFLAFGGGLSKLFNVEVDVSAASSGINDLLRGVAVAMGTTFFGVVFSIFGAIKSKSVQVENEKNKNAFFSWIQAELLPKMNNGFAGTLDLLQKNLNKFNDEFSKNSSGLNEIIKQVNDAATSQVQLYREIRKLDVEKLASANISVWKELKGATDQLGELHKYLFNSQAYLQRITVLNDKLDANEERTKLIEEMASYFKVELEQIDKRKAAISEAVGSVDEALGTGLMELKSNTQTNFTKFKEVVEAQQEELSSAIDEQKKALEAKLGEVSLIVEELRNVSEMKNSLNSMVVSAEKEAKAIEGQKQSIDNLVTTLLKQNRQPVIVNSGSGPQVSVPENVSVKIPSWMKIVGSAVAVVVVVTCSVIVLGHFNIIK